MIFYEPQSRDKKLFSARGELNLAPYSYFNAFSSNPLIVGFSSEGDKDSSTFAMEKPASSCGAWRPGRCATR